MVRINIINPRSLADQHLIAEYNEILMLLGYVSKYPKLNKVEIPDKYCLGKGHIKFFKNKLLYIKKRHESIKKEMQRRGYATNKTIVLGRFKKELVKDWKPKKSDENIIRKRLVWKLRKKPKFYTYFGEHKPAGFFIGLLKK